MSSGVAPLDDGVLAEMGDVAESILHDYRHGFDRVDDERGCRDCGYRHHGDGDCLHPKGAIWGHNEAIMGTKAPKHTRSIQVEKVQNIERTTRSMLKKFEAPDDYEKRKIVSWYDKDKTVGTEDAVFRVS